MTSKLINYFSCLKYELFLSVKRLILQRRFAGKIHVSIVIESFGLRNIDVL